MLTTHSEIQAYFGRAMPLSVRAVKLYYCSEHRNEWVNWHGDTTQMERLWGVVFTTAEAAMAAVERARTPGSKYSILQSLALEIRFSLGIVVIKEAYANEPLKRIASLKTHSDIFLIDAVLNKIPLSTRKTEFLNIRGYLTNEDPVFSDFDPSEVCYSRRSSPGGSRKNSLAWSLKPTTIYPDTVNHLVETISAFIAGSSSAKPSRDPLAITPDSKPNLVVEPPAEIDEPVVVAVLVKAHPEIAADESPLPEGECDSSETTREQITLARVGQGLFRRRLESIEPCCRMTLVAEKEHLRASHIKPWRDATDDERLDGNNGLLLSPHGDYLFDQGFISFTDKGDLLISPDLNKAVLAQWGLEEKNVGNFNCHQQAYLAYHRSKIFRASKP